MNHVRNAVAATSTLVVPALLVALAVQPEFIGSKQDVVGSTDATRTMSAKPGNRQQRVRPVVPSFVTARDTINGFRILDSEIIGRIDRIAAQVPAEALAGHGSGRQVRYLAHAFMAGDDAPI